jgi:polysaccharide export outer membrane protein
MNKVFFFKNFKILVILTILGLASSCASKKDVAYFQNLSQDNVRSNLDSTAKFEEPKIQPDDILAITIITIDPSSASAANQTGIMPSGGSSNNSADRQINGFLVDKNGEVELTMIGKVKVAGLTTYEAKELIRSKAAKDFKDPNVNLRFANFKISVLGEVAKPGAYIMPNEKVSILDVLSLAGDLTLYGKRQNILVFREIDGQKITGRLNINSTDLFKSPFYYMRQNDVIYVEPTKAKVAALNNPTRTTIGIVLSSISVLAIAFTRIF